MQNAGWVGREQARPGAEPRPDTSRPDMMPLLSRLPSVSPRLRTVSKQAAAPATTGHLPAGRPGSILSW